MNISKLVPSERLIREALRHGELKHFDNRMSGDSTGIALALLGTVMQNSTPYKVSTMGTGVNYSQDRIVFGIMKAKVRVLGLKHFVFQDQELSVRYDIWRTI